MLKRPPTDTIWTLTMPPPSFLLPLRPHEPSSTQPQESAVDAEYQEVDSDPIIAEPAVEPEPACQITEVVPNEVVATTTTALPFDTVLCDATATVSSSESESDAVDVTVLSGSDAEVTLEADDAAFDAGKDFEML
jgi:hypothetical protein